MRWVGIDPATRLPWPDQWIRLRDEHGYVMNGALRAEVRALERLKYGCHRQVHATPAAAGREPSRRSVRLAGAHDDSDMVIPPPGALRRRREQMEGAAGGEGGAWLRERRRLRMVDESSEDEL